MLVWLPERPPHIIKQPPQVKQYLHGWFGHGNRRIIDYLLEMDQPDTVIELGTWYGKSADFFMKHQYGPKRLFCVDLWSENDILGDHQVIKPHHTIRHLGQKQQVGKVMEQHPLWETFLTNLWPYRDQVLAIRNDSLTGLGIIAKYLEEIGEIDTVGFIYIDADHRYASVCEEITMAHQLFPDARLVGDDYTAHRPVRRAVDDMAERLGMEVITDHNCWYYQKK